MAIGYRWRDCVMIQSYEALIDCYVTLKVKGNVKKHALHFRLAVVGEFKRVNESPHSSKSIK